MANLNLCSSGLKPFLLIVSLSGCQFPACKLPSSTMRLQWDFPRAFSRLFLNLSSLAEGCSTLLIFVVLLLVCSNSSTSYAGSPRSGHKYCRWEYSGRGQLLLSPCWPLLFWYSPGRHWTSGCKPALLARVQLFVHQDPSPLQNCSQWVFFQSLCVFDIVLTQVWLGNPNSPFL